MFTVQLFMFDIYKLYMLYGNMLIFSFIISSFLSVEDFPV